MKNKYKNYCVLENFTIFNCSLKMNENNCNTLVVINKKNKFIGTFSMGDVRQALYHGAQLNYEIKKYYNKKAVFLIKNYKYIAKAKKIFNKSLINLIPVISKNKNILEIILRKELLKNRKKSFKKILLPAVIMSGGRGSRIKPFSDILPKALLPLNNKTIIERIIEKLIYYGIKNIYIITNYKSKILKSYFEDKKYKANLYFVEEPEELGTAGGLFLLKKKISGNFLLTNCDVLHDFHYLDFVKFHNKNNFDISVTGSLNSYQLPYGVCELDSKGVLNKITEKPNFNLIVNTGFYIISHKILKLVDNKKFMHVTSLIEKSQKLKFKIGLFPINNNNWHDVGEWDKFHKSNSFLSEEK